MEDRAKFVFVPDNVKEQFQEHFRGSVWPKPENIKGMSEEDFNGD